MALIGAAMAWARFRHFQANARSFTSLSRQAILSGDELPDMKNSGAKKKTKTPLTSLVLRYKKKFPMRVTDFTDSEWCEKRAKFVLADRKTVSQAMQVGKDRHVELGDEAAEKVIIRIRLAEDKWAMKLLDFVIGAHQLLIEGVTRELPVISLVEGEWVTGMIDEIHMPGIGTERKPLMVEVKTRSKPTLPSKEQQRNGRLQLMLYKHMWDSLVSSNFPAKKLFERFSLNPQTALSDGIFYMSKNLGIPAMTLEDMTRHFTNTCSMFPVSGDEMILRYEFQKDKSLIREKRFAHDPDWFIKQIRGSLAFWHGEREAYYVPKWERWKCTICEFASKCPVSNANINGSNLSCTNSIMDD